MAVLPISHFPEDPALRQKSKRIHFISDSIQPPTESVIETMRQGPAAPGQGGIAPVVRGPDAGNGADKILPEWDGYLFTWDNRRKIIWKRLM
jgi:hypothetical protein